ncbi:MAG TPA: tellurite resistance/C4-dicarboxylate transporter family protein [Lacipirellulaceae bacterium]|nr:tellurite resistance/C4-dicarboxylate transporter family protein [Lacipirellulaceae bacterium]
MSSTDASTRQQSAVRDLHPAYFAIVMATGIVSVAAQLRGLTGIARALLWLNLAFYAVLWILTLWRVIRFRRHFLADLWDHNRSVGFFTIVAGTCVLGNQYIVVDPRPSIAITLWIFGIILWAVVTYSILTVLTVKLNKPTLAEGIHGGWLVAVVAAQSVAALGGLVAPHLSATRDVALFFSLIMWLGGGMLYVWIIALIFYRYTFFPLDPKQLAPPYWINMGAMAISTLAGTILAQNGMDQPLLTQLQPFILGLTLLFWATATWWIPLLVVLGFWRHVVRRVSLAYDVVYWSAVFPLGMYTASTHRLVHVSGQSFLDVIPRYFIFISLAAWILAFLGLLSRFLPFAAAAMKK